MAVAQEDGSLLGVALEPALAKISETVTAQAQAGNLANSWKTTADLLLGTGVEYMAITTPIFRPRPPEELFGADFYAMPLAV